LCNRAPGGDLRTKRERADPPDVQNFSPGTAQLLRG
jgi:hypothetical protein